ncbi:MAG: dinitrogenase iron-molybdenum cofactor biosynthesis protein [Candidatus Bathyarchaeota archaeon]|nr:dinitrogenase iron-molybdenum cofactor biosynthesis protein [Candidatus Bathyarchaeota archaeon]
MPRRIVVPVADQNGLAARLAEHFGRAPFFAVVDLNDNDEVLETKTVVNVGEHAGGMGHAHDNIVKLAPEAIVVYGMGPRGLQAFHDVGITVLKANADIVGEVIAGYKDDALEELIEGCPHAHHG